MHNHTICSGLFWLLTVGFSVFFPTSDSVATSAGFFFYLKLCSLFALHDHSFFTQEPCLKPIKIAQFTM